MRRSRNRWLFLLVLIAGLGAFTAVWYAAARGTGSGEPVAGGVYVEGMTGAPFRVNPLFAALNTADQSLVSLVFAGLTRLDERGRPFPDLAETWRVSDDGLVYTFTLRAGLVWQDGAPLTATDVLFTYELLRAPAARPAPPLPAALARARLTRVDDRTLRVELEKPYSPLPAYLTIGILPAHLLQAAAPELADSPFNQRPVGAGPYRLVELTPERAVLEPNALYHAGAPYIQDFEMRFFRDDQTLLAAFNRGELDAAYFGAGLSAAASLALERQSGLRLWRLSTGSVTYVFLNLADPLFQDRRLRQALLYALDRDKLAELVYGGLAAKAESPLAAGIWSDVASLNRYGTDLGPAGSLLDEAGWRLNASGSRERRGSPLTFSLMTSPDPVHLAIANEIAAQWKQVGVVAVVEVKGGTELTRDILGPRAFDALLFEQAAAPDPDPYNVWHSSQATPAGGNLASLEDARIDALLEEARATGLQPKREEIYGRFQELFAQEVPSLPLYTTLALYVQSKDTRDVRLGLLVQPGDRFWQVHQWYVKTK